MGLKTFSIDFSELAAEISNRFDVNFIDFNTKELINTYYFTDFFEIESFSKNERLSLLDNIGDDDFYYAEISNATKQGDVNPETLNQEDQNELVADYFKKINNGDIQKVDKGNILLAKVRPNLKKYVLIDEVNSKYYYTTAFINLKPKKLGKILYYSLRTIFYENLMAISRQGKGYPTLKENDLFTLRFDKKIINKLESKQDHIVVKIEPIERKIKELKSQIKPPQDIINRIFAREFSFNLESVNATERIRYFTVHSDITYRNRNLRSSVRWNKIKPIQQTLYKDNPYIEKLGKYIITTKNGWSPNCRETDNENIVFGVNSISKDGYIKFEDLKYSDELKNNIEDYFVNENDLFISRGNTVDLVALASVVKDLPEEQNYIFPDLFIRLEVDTKNLNKEYLALLFNSIIGRYYFKYSAKGKNQTMVKISSEELNNFYLPVPPLKTQEKIIDEIKSELNEQEEIKRMIKSESNKIDAIIEKEII